MQFNSWQTFLLMGDHGFYVFSSYGVALLILSANFLSAKIQKRKILKSLINHDKHNASY